MSDEPILLFLHGIGAGDQDDDWKTALETSLAGLGYPGLDSVRVIAPKYPHALRGWNTREAVPGLTIKQPARDAAKKNRREFERRTGAVEFRLGRHDRGTSWIGTDAAVTAAVLLPLLQQARNYLSNPAIRAGVLNRILAELPASGKLVIVGHSLGSVIAADLIRRLPVGLEVAGMVTIGSPLAHGRFDVDKLRENLKEPPANLAWWVNVWNAPDPVAAHRGVSSVFPWLIDFQIATRNAPVDVRAHFAVEYLANDVVAAAVGFALFGSASKELIPVDRGVDIPLDGAELYALLALRYAHLARARLEGDVRDRFAGALRHVQAASVDAIGDRNVRENRPMPFALARLAFDLSDPRADVPEPGPSGYLEKEDAVALMTVLAAENVIRPFEITIPKEIWPAAMSDLTAEMGLKSTFGVDVFASAKEAQDALGGARGVNWIKWGALGVGAAAMIVATGGLALAAGGGLAGAAVITSALASFGPGGMIGGLLTAGALVTAGGGGIAFGLASPGTSAEALEGFVQGRLAAAILRRRQDLDPDPQVWRILAETEIEVRRQYERLDEFSDESAPALKELKRKIDTIDRALTYLSVNGFEPDEEFSNADRSD